MSRNLSKTGAKETDSPESNPNRFIEGLEEPIVAVSNNGFSLPEITIMEGQYVVFVYASSSSKLEIVQVIHDGDKLRPVIGGFRSSTVDVQGNQYEQQFNLEGEYKFALTGIRCTPLNVVVKRRVDLLADVNDDGFNPKIIYIDQGHSIKWQWKQCTVPHSVQEVKYIIDRACFKRDAESAANVVRTVTGSYRQTFQRPGLYFFQTESAELNTPHICVVHVRESQREFRVEILDRSFQPMILLIEEGDRVWWYWDKFKCKKAHSVYQIEAPAQDHGEEDPYVPVQDGFRWSAPSKQGLMSYEFYQPGVYYFSDQNFQEAAEYIGTIIVKPKQKEHYINLTDKGFEQDVVYCQTGDRVWFQWDAKQFLKDKQYFTIREIEKCLNPTSKKPATPERDDSYLGLDDEALQICTKVGLATTNYTTIGVYHYRSSIATDSMNTCSVVVNPGSKNHTIHLTDNGFEPKVITVRPDDRVWWVWQSGKKQHNIFQVSHQGVPIEGGFSSGMSRDPPSAFVHQFSEPGVFYFISSTLPKVFGAVVVSTQPRVYEVQVAAEIKPDPVTIKQNDIVCWIFRSPRTWDIAEVETADQVMADQFQNDPVTPRRCLNKAITKTGLIHFYSKSFRKQKKDSENYLEDVRFSSVICDERFDNAVIRVDGQGFHPHFYYVCKGQSVLWTWKGNEDESHNIIHVSSADSDEPLNVIHGAKSFNSGKPVPNNSFLYTFDDAGRYTVASQGAPGHSCTIIVLNRGRKVTEPFISSKVNGGTVERYSKVELACETPDSKIYYTTDGSPPELHLDSAKMYKPEKGVTLRESGLCFIRAMAVKEGFINSDIFTSRRFWVLSQDGDADKRSLSESTSSVDDQVQTKTKKDKKTWDWWSCSPTIKACFTSPGVIEVFWDLPDSHNLQLVKGYELFLNGVSYCDMFPPENNSVNVSGLAGGRLYEIVVEAYSLQKGYSPLTSNKLMMKCPIMTNEGGPVISLERSEKPDALSIVWMSIDSNEYPISGYLVFLNDQQCGSRLVPDPDSNRCKVVIGGCEFNKKHKIYVIALPKDSPNADSEDARMSNIIEITLPVDYSGIELPPENQRLDEEELYMEHLEIAEGSGYLPAMDEKNHMASKDEIRERRLAHAQPTSPHSARSLNASSGDERNKTLPHAVVEVEESRYKDMSSDQSTSTDDNEKSTQTPRGGKQRSVKVRRGYDDEFVPPSLAKKGVSGPIRRSPRDDESESETESETETESDSEETDSDDTVLTDRGSMVVMDAAHPYQEVRRSSKREREVPRRSSPRSSTRLVELDRESSVSQSGHVPKPPSQPRHERIQSSRRRERVAIIEVQESVELDSEKLTDGEERRVAVPGDAKGQMMVIDEGQFIVSEGDGILPAPSIMVESRGKNGLRVMWELPETPDPNYKLLLYVVNIVGSKFTKDINSDISFECNLVEKGKPVRGVQHCWNIQNRNNCKISGLVAGMTYRLYVIANYTMLHGQQPCEVQTTSSVIYYTTVGPPKPPRLRVVNVDLYQALIEWDPPSSMHEDLQLKGYQIYVDNKPLGGVRYKDTRQMMINNLTPGKTLSVYVVAITKQASIESDPSRVLHITCPKRPPSLFISQQPSYKSGCVLIAWNRPDGHVYATNEEDVSIYGVYVDGKWYGEVKANKMGNHHGYQYILNDLRPEQSYEVSVKCIAGYKKVDPESQHIFCLSDSPMSNVLHVMAPAAPVSPKLRLEGLHPEGIDVTWQIPQQFGDAALSGYQMLKNGQLYGSIIPPDVNSLRIRDVSLGEKVTLQLIALTEHPVGKSMERSRSGERDSGIGGSGHPEDKSGDIFLGERYAGCRPGAKLVVHYTGLVLAPSEVWCEQVSGHSALIVWNKGIPARAGQSHLLAILTDDEPKSHFVRPESYQVTWWPGDKPEDDINSDSTTDDHLLITNLRPRTTYTVVVEARKMEKYKDMDEEAESVSNKESVNAFILTSKSDSLVVKTASPPDPPSNLGILASSCSGLKIAWDPPREHGVEVIGIRIDAVSMNTSQPHHVSYNVIPDAKDAELDNLQEKTDYMIRVTAITDEYFDRLPDRHKLKKVRSLPRDTVVASDDSPWLPNSSILAKTAGTEPPANVKVVKSSTSSMTLTWTPPIVYGSNKLTSVIVRWANVKGSRKKEDDLCLASHVNLLPTEDTVTIDNLVPGALYKIVVEAVVSVKTSLQADHQDKNAEKYRRTAHVMSKPLYARARAPTDPPRLYLTGYTQTTAQLYWEKPSLVSVIGKDEDEKPKYLRRYLEGYRLEINGKTYSCLGPNAQSCSLTKCKPGKQYHIVLVALTCTDDGKKARKKMYKGFYRNSNPQSIDYAALLDDDDNLDPSPSEPLEVFLPRNQEGYTATLDTKFTHTEDRDNKTFGDITIHWTTQGDANLLKQFNIVWYNQEDRVVQTKYVSPDFRKTKIPVTRIKSVYDITIEPVYFTDVLPQHAQNVQIVIPGPPDAPEIFVKSVNPEEFVIEWGEPKLYGGVKVRGYQVYLNEKKAGNELSNSHRKAVIPCRPNKVYKVNIVALSANPEYTDSPKSNTLLINTSLHSPRQTAALDEWSHADDQEMPVKVTQVSETSIHLDWSNFLETEGVEAYKIQWSSVAQPAQREVKLSSKDSSCVINNCLPGTTHFVRLLALDGDGQIKDKSKQITVQTSAPPDCPCLSVRACNFRYIAVQWDKPTTYGDALITGYKVYVNGIVEAILNADQLSFTFTNGKWCQEYAFQVQALTAFEKLHSKVSEPLLVTWPGAQPPAIRRLPTHSSSNLRVGWEDPYLTEGIKIKHFRVCCIEEDTEKMVQSIGPIHPDTREAEFKHLKKGSYNIYLEVHLYGTSDIVCSDQIRVSPAPAPDPPRISVTVVGMEERLQLEKVTCDLVNKRDRLIRLVGHKLKEIGALTHPLRAEKNKDVIEGAHTLTRVEDLLEACFSALNHFTGQLIAHVSWACPQSKSGIDVSGYRVLIDGKQYGSPMHDGINTVRIKLGMQQPVYKLSMLSLTDKPQGASEESNVVELNSEIFRPFSFYCYHSIHGKDVMWPHQGCCQYQDSIAYERQLAKKLANQGLLKRKVPPPSCSLLDVFDGEYKPLLGTHNKQFATAILFWTPWCIASQKSMANFARFARETASEYNFIAVTCGVNATVANDRKQLIHDITSNGWREDRIIWHCTSQCASAIHEATNGRWKNTTAGPTKRPDIDDEKYMDLTELLGIAGVPTFLFLHQDGYISWHGRYSAFDYASFAAFMRHTFAEVLGLPCPVFKCDCCKNDTNVEDELIEPVLKIVHDTPTRSATMKSASPKERRPESPNHISLQDQHKYADEQTVERLFLPRKQSPRRKKKASKITVNQRPYSASTYVQLLKSPYMQKVVPSPKVLNKLLRPQSGGPRLG